MFNNLSQQDKINLQEYLGKQRWYGLKNNIINTVELISSTECLYFIKINNIYICTLYLIETQEQNLNTLVIKNKYYIDALTNSNFLSEFLELEINNSSDFELLNLEQSNSMVLYQNKYIIKFYRQLNSQNQEVKLLNILSNKQYIPELIKEIKYNNQTVALVQLFVPEAITLWEHLAGDISGEQKILIIQKLAQITVDMHNTICDFSKSKQNINISYINEFEININRKLNTVKQYLEEKLIVKLQSIIKKYIEILRKSEILIINLHHDYHLGQVLYSKANLQLYIIDFEGEPAANAANSPAPIYKDLAGMIRSFEYLGLNSEYIELLIQEYFKNINKKLAGNSELLELYKIDKALYELNYEANNRPDWVNIPLGYLENIS